MMNNYHDNNNVQIRQIDTSLNAQLSPLPKGISPFEVSLSKSLDVQAEFRSIAKKAVDAAMSSSVNLIELEFPPLIGGSQSKSQFDDFDNIQELDSNKDWTIQFAPLFVINQEFSNGKLWLIFPDLKECELARKEWQGSRYQAATFTTIESATNFLSEGSYDKPWGASFASGMNQLLGGAKSSSDDSSGAGLLGDERALDQLVQGENAPSTMNLIIQPGNGGPVEDWINVEKIYDQSPDSTTHIIVNGALDKVRDGYYPGVFFPKLKKTSDRFYTKFESVFYLKPISDKGVYGWLYRCYPEQWQVVLQTVKTANNGGNYIEDKVVYASDKRPSYTEAVMKLLEGSRQQS